MAAVQCSHYAEPTIATSLKDYAKPGERAKPSRRQPPAIERRPRSPNHARDNRHNVLRTPHRPSDRICVSDDEADRLMRPGPGRLSYSDDERSVRQQSSPRYVSHCSHCLRHESSLHSTTEESAARPALSQSRYVPVQQEHESSLRPQQHGGCYACSSRAALRYCCNHTQTHMHNVLMDIFC